jgi:hypothetical protein
MHRRSKKVLIGIGVVVIVLGTIYTVALLRSLGKLKRAYAALEQDGRPTQATELIPPEIPDADNAAALYLRAAAMLKEQPAPKKDLLEYLQDLASSYVGDALDPNKLPELKELMARPVVFAALSTFEEALQRPACRFERDYRNGLAGEPFAPRDLYYLTRIAAAQARFELEAGQSDEAWHRMRSHFRLLDALAADPTFSSQLARLSLAGHLCRVIERFSEMAPLSDEHYHEIQNLLERADDITPLVRAADAERLLRGEWLFNQTEDQLYETLRTGDLSLGGDEAPDVLYRLVFRLIAFKPRLVADHAGYLQYMAAGTRLLQGPFVPSDVARKELGDGKGWHILRQLLAPRIDRFQEFHCRAAARIHITRAGLALLRHRQIHGTLPSTLDALDLEGLVDPFTDEPLHYRPEGQGFVVYSVSEDQEDNGGSPRQHLQKTGYDLPWQSPRPSGPTASGGQ